MERSRKLDNGTEVQRAQAMMAAALSSGSGEAGAAATVTVRSSRPLTTLWAGYGTISEVETAEGECLIVKEVHPPVSSGVSLVRKLRSYQVEAAFYEGVAARLPAGAAVPRCLGVHSTLHSSDGSGSDGDAGGMQLVMSDLRKDFPRSCGNLDEAHTKAALSWLAAFHAACWGADAEALGLWPEGCYWHLQTRLDEYEEIGREWGALRAVAHELDRRLAATPWRTVTHGDFKTANLQFSDSSTAPQCAAVDFQYCGGGSGLKDVVYLLASGVAPRLLQGGGEEALLRHYHAELVEGLRAMAGRSGSSSGGGDPSSSGTGDGSGRKRGGGGSGGGEVGGRGGPVGCPAKAAQAVEGYSWDALQGDYRLAVTDYVRFMAGWGFWGNTAWVSARARTCLAELGLA